MTLTDTISFVIFVVLLIAFIYAVWYYNKELNIKIAKKRKKT